MIRSEWDDLPVHELASKLLSIERQLQEVESPHRTRVLREGADRLTRLILDQIEVDEAVAREGRVLVPFEVDGITRLRPLKIRDLDAEADEHGVKLLGKALERLCGGEFLDDRDHRRVVESLYLLTDCSADEAELVIVELAKGTCPLNPAKLAEMASGYLELDRMGSRPTVADQVFEPFASSLDQVLREDL